MRHLVQSTVKRSEGPPLFHVPFGGVVRVICGRGIHGLLQLSPQMPPSAFTKAVLLIVKTNH